MSKIEIKFIEIFKDLKKSRIVVDNFKEKILFEYKSGLNFRRTQEVLVRSLDARKIALNKVYSNKVSKTAGSKKAGIDGVKLISKEDVVKVFNDLSSIEMKNYKCSPVKKKNALGIPSIVDRVYQALWLEAVEPISNFTSDRSSYAYMKGVSALDAIKKVEYTCWHPLKGGKVVLDCDIEGFFDNISHDWILNNIPINTKVLDLWIKAGYIYENKLNPILSAVIANMALDGLETIINNNNGKLIRYAEDFVVILGNGESIDKVLSEIEVFLSKRKLKINKLKTKISNSLDGFSYLSHDFKVSKDKNSKYKCYLSPTDSSLKSLDDKLKDISNRTHLDLDEYILLFNSVTRGFVNYFKLTRNSCNWLKILNNAIWKYTWLWATAKWSESTKNNLYQNKFQGHGVLKGNKYMIKKFKKEDLIFASNYNNKVR